MNVRDWSGEASNQPLRSVLILMASISAVIIVLAIFFAFMPSLGSVRRIAEAYPVLTHRPKRTSKPEGEGGDDQSTAGLRVTLNNHAAQPRHSLWDRFSAAFRHPHHPPN